MLSAVEDDFAAILALANVSFRRRAILWAHREVNPIRRTALLEDKLIKFPFSPIGDIQQYPRHPDHLLRTIASDIHRTSRQVIAPLRAPAQSVHFLAPIPARNNDRNTCGS